MQTTIATKQSTVAIQVCPFGCADSATKHTEARYSNPPLTVSDPIFSCFGQRIKNDSTALRADISDQYVNLTEQIDAWTDLVEFGQANHLISLKTQSFLEKALDNDQLVNRALIMCVNEVNTALDKCFKQSIAQVTSSLDTWGISLPSHLGKFAKSGWSYEVGFIHSEDGYGEDALDANSWGMRMLASSGVSSLSLGCLHDAPLPIGRLYAALINVLCLYGHKAHSEHLDCIPIGYNVFEEFNDSIDSQTQATALQMLDDPNVDSDKVLAYLTEQGVSWEEVECMCEEDDNVTDIIHAHLERMNFLSIFHKMGIPRESSRFETLIAIEQELAMIGCSDSPLKAHPDYLHMVKLMDVAKTHIRTDVALNDISKIGADLDIDAFSVVSVLDSDESRLEDIHEHTMQTGEIGVRKLHIDHSNQAIEALHNMIVADLLLLSMDREPISGETQTSS